MLWARIRIVVVHSDPLVRFVLYGAYRIYRSVLRDALKAGARCVRDSPRGHLIAIGGHISPAQRLRERRCASQCDAANNPIPSDFAPYSTSISHDHFHMHAMVHGSRLQSRVSINRHRGQSVAATPWRQDYQHISPEHTHLVLPRSRFHRVESPRYHKYTSSSTADLSNAVSGWACRAAFHHECHCG